MQIIIIIICIDFLTLGDNGYQYKNECLKENVMAAAKMDGLGNSYDSGFLSKTFGDVSASGLLFKGALAVGAFALFGYVDNMIFDPFFFPIIHDPANETGQALIAFMADKFSWAHEITGLTGDGGLANTDFVQRFLDPYYASDANAIIDSYSGVGSSGGGDAMMEGLLGG